MGPEDSIRFFAARMWGAYATTTRTTTRRQEAQPFRGRRRDGGHAAGEVASALAVRTVHDEVKKERQLIDDYNAGTTGAGKVTDRDILNLLEFAVQRACARIHEEAQGDKQKRAWERPSRPF